MTLWQLLDVALPQQQALAKLVTEAMAELGWERRKMRFGGANSQWGFAKGDDFQQTNILTWPLPAKALPTEIPAAA